MNRFSTSVLCALTMVLALGCREVYSQDCGDKVREGYLAPYGGVVSAIDRIENVTSTAGLTCIVDTCVSKTVAENLSVDQSCEDNRRTSSCYLEKIGLIDSVEDAVLYTDAIKLTGNMEKVSICRPSAACESKSESCTVCENETLFVPCEYQLK